MKTAVNMTPQRMGMDLFDGVSKILLSCIRWRIKKADAGTYWISQAPREGWTWVWLLFSVINGPIGTGGDAQTVQVAFGLVDGGYAVYYGDGIHGAGDDTISRSFTFFRINDYFHVFAT